MVIKQTTCIHELSNHNNANTENAKHLTLFTQRVCLKKINSDEKRRILF